MTPQAPLHDASEAAALYVAGALTAEEAAAFEARMAEDATCLAEFRKLECVAAALFASVQSLPPPANVRAALDSRIATNATIRDTNAGTVVLPLGKEPGPPQRGTGKRANSGRRGWLGTAGWLAAAASLLFAVGLWLSLRPSAANPEQQRLTLLQTYGKPGSDVVKIDWTATNDPAARDASGDVVWSTSAQQGFVRFHGLAANAPGAYQYQLWLFDADRDERYPVDGGVFDIPANGGDVIVPITPKLRVGRPMMFALTIEKPGGVVVSTRERVTLVAKVS
jgi:anti-sigma-K factor RskA